MKKTKLTRSLLAACSIVALSAVAYGCSSGISQSEADKQAAEAAAAAKAEAEAAAAAAAAEAAAKAEAERQAALDAQQAALEKAARAKVQAANIGAATAAAETALGMVVLGASDADIADADAKLQALRDAITAAVDVDDTSADSLRADGIETSLTTAKALVKQERGDRKAERADFAAGRNRCRDRGCERCGRVGGGRRQQRGDHRRRVCGPGCQGCHHGSGRCGRHEHGHRNRRWHRQRPHGRRRTRSWRIG